MRVPVQESAVRNVAVVLAGGVGARMGLDVPKQFIPIAGKSSLEHTVGVFEDSPLIDDIVVMTASGTEGWAHELLPTHRFPKVRAVLSGGTTRNHTSFLALQALHGARDKVLFHDAVRPLLDAHIIEHCLTALDDYDAVDTAIPSSDTIIEVDEHDHLRAVPPRDMLRRGQTPQGFRRDVLLDAYSRAWRDPTFQATDDCSVVLRYRPDVPILVVPGAEANIKITHPIDVHIADKLFLLRRRGEHEQTNPGLSVSGQIVVVFGGTSGIGAELADQLESEGAVVIRHSRTTTGVHVEDRDAVRASLRDAFQQYGSISHVVLAAGLLRPGDLVTTSPEDVARCIAVNLTAACIVAQESYPFLRLSEGSLLLYSSSSSTRGRAGYAVYSATKAAIVNLSQALADEWRHENVRVNCISPGRTATPMREKAFGLERRATLLGADVVARVSRAALISADTGQVYDVQAAPLMTSTSEHVQA